MLRQLLLPVCCILLAGCASEERNCSSSAPVITTNSPVFQAMDITLETPFVQQGTFYWTGPNGFHSALQNPVIHLATPAMAGTYTLTVGSEIEQCHSPVATAEIVINPAVPPCSPQTDIFTCSAYFSDMQYIYTEARTDSDSFILDGVAEEGDNHIYFATTDNPLPGQYRIHSTATGFLEPNEVYMYMINYTGSSYFAQEGLVYIKYIDGKISATYCEVPFSNGQSDQPINFNSSGNITADLPD
jgi:hypothetical protein